VSHLLIAVASRTISSPWRSDILRLAHERRFGKLVVARWLILPAGEFGPQDADLIGGVEGEAHLVADDAHDGDGDAVATTPVRTSRAPAK